LKTFRGLRGVNPLRDLRVAVYQTTELEDQAPRMF
jgi:hypothetical protein